MQESHSKPVRSHRRWRTCAALLAGALCACAAWHFLGRPSKTPAAFVPPSGGTSACWVRDNSSLRRLAELGFEDAEAWEVGAAQDGWLTTTLSVSDREGVQVRVPLEAGTTAYVWYRVQLARSGLQTFFDVEGAPNPIPAGEYGWFHPADRWTFTLTVLFPRVPAFTDGVEFADGAVRDLGSRLKTFSRINQGPLPFHLIDGPRASVSVSCTPSGSLAIPADARVAGQTLGLLPVDDAWASLPENNKPLPLHEIEWATRNASGGRRAIGTWNLGLEFHAAE